MKNELREIALGLAISFGFTTWDQFSALLEISAFRDLSSYQDEDKVLLAMTAKTYGLNPTNREIYAGLGNTGHIVPIVGIDGWFKIINAHKEYDGMEVKHSDDLSHPDGGKECPAWIQCTIYRKDRKNPTIHREFLEEVYVPSLEGHPNSAWQTHTRRRLEQVAMQQTARIALGITGIYDTDILLTSMNIVSDDTTQKVTEITNEMTEIIEKSFQLGSKNAGQELLEKRYSGDSLVVASNLLNEKFNNSSATPKIAQLIQDNVDDSAVIETDNVINTASEEGVEAGLDDTDVINTASKEVVETGLDDVDVLNANAVDQPLVTESDLKLDVQEVVNASSGLNNSEQSKKTNVARFPTFDLSGSSEGGYF